MYRLISSLALLFHSLVLFSQYLNAPQLCYITTNLDSTVTLYWKYDDTTKIDGFIIKRIIYEGEGVVDGTLNNISIVGKQLEYLDTSTAYNTTTKPFARSETYAVSAFKLLNNNLIFSPMSIMHSTMFLRYSYDSCSNTLNLRWNSYKGANIIKYEIWRGSTPTTATKLADVANSDTTYSLKDLPPNAYHSIFVKAILDQNLLCQNSSSNSNFISLFNRTTQKPQIFYNEFVSILDDNQIQISYISEQFQNITAAKLYRNNIFIASIDTNIWSYNDVVTTQVPNCYRIDIFDICNKATFSSQTICSSILKYQEIDNQVVLTWDEILIDQEKPDYNILQIFQLNQWQDFSQISGNLQSATLNLVDIIELIEKNKLNSIKVRICGQKNNKNSYTNPIEISLKPIILIPDAINPYSTIDENRYFTVKSLLVENLNIKIFTTDGVQLFKSTPSQQSWDARTPAGQIVPAGVYIYFIEYTDKKGMKYSKKGTFNVIY